MVLIRIRIYFEDVLKEVQGNWSILVLNCSFSGRV